MYYDPAATGERIQNLRKDREVTQEQLAIDLNISDRYMRNLEKGEKVPSVDLFVELRERFGSSLDYIVLGVSASQREQELQDQLQMLRKELKEMQRRILVMLEMLGEWASCMNPKSWHGAAPKSGHTMRTDGSPQWFKMIH